MISRLGHFINAMIGRNGGITGVSAEQNGTIQLFAVEGILFALVNSLLLYNNSLYAIRLGATDLELSFLSTFPQLVGFLVLIPGGILTDRMPNKRRMVILSLSLLASAYLLISLVPVLQANRFYVFLVFLSFSLGPLMIYNASWQAYFSDMVPVDQRNGALTMRTRAMFLASILIPLLCGTLLASVSEIGVKIRMHQFFYLSVFVIIVFQIFVHTRIQGGNSGKQTIIKLAEIKNAVLDLAHNKRFLGFAGVALFFYMTWQLDWTMYFVGQVRFLKLNEAWLSYASIGAALMQFSTIGIWSRVNEKRGVRFSIILGSLGLSLCPLSIIIATSVPHDTGPLLFLILNTLSNLAFATIPLGILQGLLQVIPGENKTLSISIYTVLITLSNAIMPMVGVKLFTFLGANLQALHQTFYIIMVLRIIAASLWILRWQQLRAEPK